MNLTSRTPSFDSGWASARPRALCLAFALVLGTTVLGLSSCGSQEPRPNVVLIVIDTLRADHLACYGYERDTTPFLSLLAKEGVVCARTHSTSSWTAPAMASLLTSLNPVQHGVLSGFLATQERRKSDTTITLDRIPDALETLAETLGAAGYQTFAVADNHNICKEMGFSQGFDRFQNMNYRSAKVVNATVMEWADQISSANPYFLYLHYMDPHSPYHQQDPEYRSQGDDLLDKLAAYDSEITYVDEMIRELYKHFGWDRNTVVVVTADHGEEFQDHGGWEHGHTLYHEVMDVPLIFVFPDETAAASRLETRASILDIIPTLRDYLQLAASDQDQGISLLPLFRSQADQSGQDDRMFFAHLHSAPWLGDLDLQAVIQDSDKLVVTQPDQRELFDLDADPQELINLSEQKPEVITELWGIFQQRQGEWFKVDPEKVETTLTPEEIKKLKSLGYAQ